MFTSNLLTLLFFYMSEWHTHEGANQKPLTTSTISKEDPEFIYQENCGDGRPIWFILSLHLQE